MFSLKSLMLSVCLSLAISSLAVPVLAQSSLNTQNTQISVRVSFASEAITVSSVAIGFTAGTINPTVPDKPAASSQATLAVCSNTGTATLNILDTGTNPNATTIGLPVPAGGSFKVYGFTNISRFRAISTGADSPLYCIYYRLP